MGNLHVRWRKDTGSAGKGRTCWVADLLDSDDDRQRRVVEFGRIEERFLTTPAVDARAFHQGIFWAAADRKLDRLGLDADARRRIEADLSATVPRPHPDWALQAVSCTVRYDRS